MEHILQVLTEKIGERTSISFASISISKVILSLRDEHDCFNYVVINENRYTEGLNALTVSEGINSVSSHEFYSAVKALFEKILEGFEDNKDIHFVDELRKAAPDVFYALDTLNGERGNKTKQKIMLIDNSRDLIEKVKDGLNKISDEYEITGASSSVECFDLLASGYTPKLILLDIMMPDMKGYDIFNKLKGNSAWEDIPVVFLTSKTDSINKLSAQGHITKPFDITDLKNGIDKVLKEIKNV